MSSGEYFGIGGWAKDLVNDSSTRRSGGPYLKILDGDEEPPDGWSGKLLCSFELRQFQPGQEEAMRVAKQKALVRQLKKDGGEFGPAVVELTALKKQLAEMAGSDVGQTFDVSFWFFPFPFPTGEAARAGVGIGLAVPEYGLRRMDSSFSLRSFLLSYRLELGCVSVSYPISSLRLLFFQ